MIRDYFELGNFQPISFFITLVTHQCIVLAVANASTLNNPLCLGSCIIDEVLHRGPISKDVTAWTSRFPSRHYTKLIYENNPLYLDIIHFIRKLQGRGINGVAKFNALIFVHAQDNRPFFVLAETLNTADIHQ